MTTKTVYFNISERQEKNASMKIAKFQAENDLIEAKRQKMKVFGFSIFLEQITDVNFL